MSRVESFLFIVREFVSLRWVNEPQIVMMASNDVEVWKLFHPFFLFISFSYRRSSSHSHYARTKNCVQNDHHGPSGEWIYTFLFHHHQRAARAIENIKQIFWQVFLLCQWKSQKNEWARRQMVNVQRRVCCTVKNIFGHFFILRWARALPNPLSTVHRFIPT